MRIGVYAVVRLMLGPPSFELAASKSPELQACRVTVQGLWFGVPVGVRGKENVGWD